ncbi:MAG: rRNA maturation RNase YbeY [Chloroflexota bacterium]|nr:rRNA maturation RNase YbeY [Chloroflexota bacterium]
MNGNPQPQAHNDNSVLSTQHSALVEGSRVSTDPGSSYLITVQMEEQYDSRLDADALHRLAMEVLKAERVAGPVEVGVVITTDAEVRALNKQYLGHDYETDVLSFGMMEDDEFVTPTERPSYLGDVVVSYDRAAEQAPEYGHTTQMEVATLVVHGLLHLLGYNDAEDTERERMHARQQEILSIFDFRF